MQFSGVTATVAPPITVGTESAIRNYLKTPIDGGDDTTTIRRRVE
jgi:hypothetical protein